MYFLISSPLLGPSVYFFYSDLFCLQLFVNVCVNVSYSLIFFLMSLGKNQQPHFLHIILDYLSFVTTTFRLDIFEFYDFYFT